MDKKLKFILILFPVILVGAYFYGLTNDFTIEGLIIVQPSGSELFIINCPVGYNEITSPTGSPPSPENTGCVRDSANVQQEVVLFCGDEIVVQGMVETVTCSMIVP